MTHAATPDASGLIRITKVPAGEAPVWAREEWVGLVLPCEPTAGEFPELGVVSGHFRPRIRPTFSVPQKEALEILAQKSKVAADWFHCSGYPHPEGFFGFGVDEAEIIQGVTQPVAIMRDDWDGDSEK